MRGWSGLRLASWATLGVVLAALAGVALVADRWGRPLPGEATALMQAESLAFDLDLVYTRADYDRFLERGGTPRELALASGSGARITWDRPFPYAAWLAPFVRFAPRRAAPLANALALVLAAVLAAGLLERGAGDATALWIAIFVAGSAVVGNLLLAREGIFLLAVVAVAFALVARAHAPLRPRLDLPEVWGEDELRPAAAVSAWLLVGVLLAVPAAFRVEYGVLALAAFFAVPAERRAAGRGSLFLGFAGALVALALVAWWNGGGLLGFGSRTLRFTAESGFPLVDFPASAWEPTVRRLAATTWEEAPRLDWGFDLGLAGWNLLYLVAGRHGGLLVGFAPLLLLAFVGSLAGFRKAVLAATLGWAALLLALHPFDLFGGLGAVGNRLFLPLYGALWTLVARRLSPGAAAATAAFVLALAAPSMLPLWRAPETPPPAAGGEAVAPGPLGRRLPYETSQRWLPGGQTVEHEGIWLRCLDDGAWVESQRGRLVLDGGRPAGLMLIAPQPLAAIVLRFGAEASSRLEVDGGAVGDRLLARDGGIGFRVALTGRARRHPLWLTPQRSWIYVVTLQMPEVAAGARLPFRLEPELAGDGDAGSTP